MLRQLIHELAEGNPHGPAEIVKLDDIKAALTSLALADEGLSLMESLSELFLRQPGTLSGGAEPAQEDPVVLSEHRPGHNEPDFKRIVDSGIVQNGLLRKAAGRSAHDM
jgi:hypothetical protein